MSTCAIETATGHFDERVLRRLGQHVAAATDQRDLFRLLPGLFPGDIATKLAERASFGCADSARLLSSMRDGDRSRRAVVRAGLGLPHPVDFEWLFTAETTRSLGREISRRADQVACVGAPSVFQDLRAHYNVRLLLADRLGLANVLRGGNSGSTVIELDEVGASPLRGAADLAVVDPPWYPGETVFFAGMGAALTKVGGHVWVVVPPAFTRPGVRSEIRAILSQLERLGLRRVETREAAVRYQSPPFEVATLKAIGLFGVPHDWRVGDILVLEVLRTIDPLHLRKPDSEGPWDELQFKSSRIKFRKANAARGTDPSVYSLVQGDVLTSVSRRNSMRGGIDVWTTGNRAFECAAPHVLMTGFGAFMESRDPIRACIDTFGSSLEVRRAELTQAIEILAAILEDEQGEVEWLSPT